MPTLKETTSSSSSSCCSAKQQKASIHDSYSGKPSCKRRCFYREVQQTVFHSTYSHTYTVSTSLYIVQRFRDNHRERGGWYRHEHLCSIKHSGWQAPLFLLLVMDSCIRVVLWQSHGSTGIRARHLPRHSVRIPVILMALGTLYLQ